MREYVGKRKGEAGRGGKREGTRDLNAGAKQHLGMRRMI